MRLLRPDGGRIVLHGRDITAASEAELREGRRDIQMVFQDPFSSLNPRLTCRRIVARNPSRSTASRRGARRRTGVAEMFARTGLRLEHP